MKNILLALLLANILYFLWGMFTEEAPQSGVAVIDESDVGPPLDVNTSRGSDAVARVGAVAGSDDASALQAVAGPACITVGPFRENVDADTAVLEYNNDGMKAAIRKTRGQLFVGHWVQIRNVANNASATQMLKTLSDGGLSDAYLVRTEDEGMKISLGLFGDLERAEKIELQARSLNLPAEISPRMRDGDLFFVDVRLPPGKGAGAIVEKYGQERVLMREAATCPD